MTCLAARAAASRFFNGVRVVVVVTVVVVVIVLKLRVSEIFSRSEWEGWVRRDGDLRGSRRHHGQQKARAVCSAGTNVRHFPRSSTCYCSGAVIGITSGVIVDKGEGKLGHGQGQDEGQKLHHRYK